MKSLNSSVALLFFISMSAYKPDNFNKEPQLNYNYPMLNIQENNRVTDVQRALINSFKELWRNKLQYTKLESNTFDIVIKFLENAYQLEVGLVFNEVMKDFQLNIISYCGNILNDMEKNFTTDEQRIIIDDYRDNINKFSNKVMFKDDVDELLVLVRKMKTTFSDFKNTRMQKVREWQNEFSMTKDNSINISKMKFVVNQIIYGAIPLAALEEKKWYDWGTYRVQLLCNISYILEYIKKNFRMDMNTNITLSNYQFDLNFLRNKKSLNQKDLSDLLILIENIEKSYNAWK